MGLESSCHGDFGEFCFMSWLCRGVACVFVCRRMCVLMSWCRHSAAAAAARG